MSETSPTVNVDITVMDDIKVKLDDIDAKVDNILVEIQRLRDSVQSEATTESTA